MGGGGAGGGARLRRGPEGPATKHQRSPFATNCRLSARPWAGIQKKLGGTPLANGAAQAPPVQVDFSGLLISTQPDVGSLQKVFDPRSFHLMQGFRGVVHEGHRQARFGRAGQRGAGEVLARPLLPRTGGCKPGGVEEGKMQLQPIDLQKNRAAVRG